MSNLDDRLLDVKDRIHVDWNEARTERALQGLHRKKRRRAQTRAGLVAASVVALVLVGVRVRDRGYAGPVVAGALASPVATPLGAPGDSEIVTNGVDRFQVVRGSGRFVLPHSPAPRVVEIGSVRVDADEASFEISRGPTEVTVKVLQGRVHVAFRLGASELVAGEQRSFSLLEGENLPAPSASLPPPKPSSSAVQRPAPVADWRAAASYGKFDVARELLERAGQGAVKDEPEDLLLAADVARKSHHSADAVEPLSKILRAHRADERAPLAAFSLGKVFLDELGRPGEAANAFREAYDLAPGGPLAEDALGREVEAASRAGDRARTQARANVYLKLFPEGARVRAVRRFAGLTE